VHRRLSRAPDRTGHQEIGHVQTGQEKKKTDRSQERDQDPLRVAPQIGVDRLYEGFRS
jgi:hypothetical protein